MTASSLDGIAIIGMAARFPGANSIDRFWENLKNGVESISFFTDEELLESGVAPAELKKNNYVRARGIIDDAEMFDAAFFGFNPREAQVIDPQHRVFLECSYHALEAAGYDPHAYPGAIGVYAGTSLSNYLFRLYASIDVVDLVGGFQAEIGNDKDFLSTRVSYKLNLKGPSINVNTACSTSLVATCLACQHLLHYQCDIALAGGVSISIPQKNGYLYQEGGINSPDGHCRAFDARAQGTVGGNGVGVVALKRLAEAVADGDYIYAVIKGSAINNDGSSKVGYTAPSSEGQAEVIAMAQAVSGISPETITYIEAHGTGTPLGDPIEISALSKCFRSKTKKKKYCAIGSVKSNLGHLDAAAGVAGLIKTALSLKHKMIPASLHFENPNSRIDFANSPFYVNNRLQEWKTKGIPRRAGVSSFGIGGTNAHLVLEEAPEPPPSGPSRAYQLLSFSAKSESALDKAIANMLEYLNRHPEASLADAAYTLHLGRMAFNYRGMAICRDRQDAIEALQSGRVFKSHQDTTRRPVLFLFPGQGAQYVGMGRELYDKEEAFRRTVEKGAGILKEGFGIDLLEVIYPREGREEEARELLNRTEITQPALYVIECGLGRMMEEWGIRPEVMIGHSIGEYVAATMSGVVEYEEGVRLVAARGRLMQEAPRGSMLSVGLSRERAEKVAEGKVDVAAINGEELCVMSGEDEAIGELEERLRGEGIWTRRLKTSHAFHSRMMDGVVEKFGAEVSKVKLKAPKIPYLSNVTGKWVTAKEAQDVSYWTRHLRQTVRFSEGIQELIKKEGAILLELGPGRSLSGIARQYVKTGLATIHSVLSSSEQPQSDVEALVTTMGNLWLAGAAIDWSRFYKGQQRRRIPLPTYPYERKRFWVEPSYIAARSIPAKSLNGARRDIADWFYVPSWKQSIPPSLHTKDSLSESGSRWLLFIDSLGLGENLAKRLEMENQNVIVVEVGDRFIKKDERRFALDPREPECFDALFRELREQGNAPNRIIHLWNVTPGNEHRLDPHSFEDSDSYGFFSLLFLGQTIKRQNLAGAIDLTVISTDVQSVTGAEELCPEKAMLVAACKIIPQEFPAIACRNIDLRVEDLSPLQGQLVNQLLAELTAELPESLVAYRHNCRWVQTLEAVRMNGNTKPHSRLKEGSVYLITGGLETVGMELAEYIARAVKAKLALVTSAQFPGRERWDLYLALHPKTDSVSRKILKIRAIEEMGASVLIIEADAASREQMRLSIARTVERFGGINGVIHVEEGHLERPPLSIDAISPDQCRAHIRRKAQALLALDKALQGIDIDFCILLSSLTPILGGPGAIAYCAANIFQDVFAHKRYQSDRMPWMSINWELKPEDRTPSEEDVLAHMAITPAEGIDAFSRALSIGEVPQVIVSATTLKQSNRLRIKREPIEDAAAPVASKTNSLHPRPNLRTKYVAPRSDNERAIVELWQELLGVAQVGIEDDFFELGGHSLLAIQLVRRLLEVFGVELQTNYLLNKPTIVGLIDLINKTGGASHARRSALLPLQPKGAKRPFFCVHPIGGSAFCFLKLARLLGTNQPFYGLQAKDLADIVEQADSYERIEEVAARYIESIRDLQPQGPYLIGGFSWGSIVAFEMAQQLRRQSEDVPLLVIIDTPSPDIVGRMSTLDESVLLLVIVRDLALQRGVELSISVEELSGLDREDRLRSVLNTLKEAEILPSSIDFSWLGRHAQGYRTRMMAVKNYAPQVYPGRITLFRAQETDAQVDRYLDRIQDGLRDPAFGWGKLSTEPIDVYEVTGNHSVIMLEPHIEVLARYLKSCIEKVRKE